MFQILVGRSKGEFCDALDLNGILYLCQAIGGWGVKNMHSFSTTLAEKIGWRLISSNNL
jgi:hypothetical protein